MTPESLLGIRLGKIRSGHVRFSEVWQVVTFEDTGGFNTQTEF